MSRGDNISNTQRPEEYKFWMVSIGVICMAGFLAGVSPTIGTILDYFFVLLIACAFIALVGYGVKEVIKEKRFWSSNIGDKDYDRYGKGPS